MRKQSEKGFLSTLPRTTNKSKQNLSNSSMSPDSLSHEIGTQFLMMIISTQTQPHQPIALLAI